MKLILLSDTHIRATSPIGRKDDLAITQWRKWKFIFDTAKQEGITDIIQAGDLWNEPCPPYYILNTFIKMLFQYNTQIYTVMGQHDQYMRSPDLSRTATGILQETLFASVLGYRPLIIRKGKEEVALFGVGFGDASSWKDPYWKIQRSEYQKKIAVMHAMIGDIPLYPGQEDLVQASHVLEEMSEMDVILCGDYHYPYHYELEGRHIVNTGCLLRLTRNAMDMSRKLHFYIYDTITGEMKKVQIPMRLASSVFNLKEKVIEKQDRLLEELIERVKASDKVGISFLSILQTFFEENHIRKEVRNIIADSFGGKL